MADVIRVEQLQRVYHLGAVDVPALRGIDFAIPQGQMVAIMGPSGSGKSTLLNLLGCLDRPSGGKYLLAGEDVGLKTDDELAEVRNARIGFVFQNYNLLPQLTALENVELPLVYRGLSASNRRRKAEAALASVGLGDRKHHRPLELSGGQQQRVGVARALAGEPDVILADEPTGNLDSTSGQEVLRLFLDLHRAGSTIVIVTHDDEVALYTERTIHLRDGIVVSDGPIPSEQRRGLDERGAS
ncbi:MAG: ABC transporter ATP-binding protein [Thermaerobacter sp.]|nr:ABC transporter ATP-binding protein [Thermaerobacter sp.]